MTEAKAGIDVSAERELLEGVLFAPREAKRLIAMVRGMEFTDPSARVVFDAAWNVAGCGEPVNVHTVQAHLRSSGLLRSVDRSFFERTCPDAELVPRAEHAARRLLELSNDVAQRPSAESSLVSPHPGAGVLHQKETQPGAAAPHQPHQQTDDDVKLHDFASVEKSLPDVTWLWEGWLPRGLVTVLASSPGEGKSALALEIARRVVSCVGGDLCVPPASSQDKEAGAHIGAPLQKRKEGPHIGGPLQEKATVVLVDTEASEAILRRRVREWSIPKERLCVFASAGPVAGMVGLSIDEAEDWRRLESAVTAARPALVIIDSLSGAHAMEESSSRMRLLLLKLARLARDSQAAFLVVHHLRKRSRSESDAATLERLRGSSTLAQIARCVWTIDRPDPNDPSRRLSQVKNNLVPLPAPLGFTIGATGVAFCDAPEKPHVPTQAERAEEFLRDLLGKGPVSAAEIYRESEERGLSKMTLWRAAESLGVLRARDGHLGPWCWAIPKDNRPAPPAGT